MRLPYKENGSSFKRIFICFAPDSMRLFACLGLLFVPTLAAAQSPFDYPVSNPERAKVEAIFKKTSYDDSKSEGTKIAIKDREGKTLFEKELVRDFARTARWTEDGKFLIVTAVNGAGHQPWHYHVYVFSLAEREIRQLDDFSGRPIVSAEIWCQPPDIFILVGHTFDHDIAAPDDPVLIRYQASVIWAKLLKV
jgi:hypothetical protein